MCYDVSFLADYVFRANVLSKLAIVIRLPLKPVYLNEAIFYKQFGLPRIIANYSSSFKIKV